MYWQAADIAIVRYFANDTGTFGIIRNNKNFAISLTSSTGTGDDIPGTGLALSPGESTTTFRILSTVSGAQCAAAGTGSFTVPVSELGYGYKDPAYNTVYNFTGIKPLVGSC